LHSISSVSVMKLSNAGSIALISDITICKLERSARAPLLDSRSWPCRIYKIHEQVRKHSLKTGKSNWQICTCAQSAAKNSFFSLTQQLSSRRFAKMLIWVLAYALSSVIVICWEAIKRSDQAKSGPHPNNDQNL
jgi:hypothetical protein